MTSDAIAPAVSFELYPPRSPEAVRALPQTIERLAAVEPAFVSVTFGAGGSSRGESLDVVRHILASTTVRPMAHLTCVGTTHAEMSALIREFLDAGVLDFLAVRGDPPTDASDEALGEIRSSAELVQLIDRVQAERAPYREREVPGIPGARALGEGRDHVRIAVAAFPNGHPHSRTPSQDIDALLAKQAAGATLAITQLFFHASDYLRFVERARAAGVRMPILPGLAPVTSFARLNRMLELSGEDTPSELAIRLEIEPTDEGRRQIGIDWAAEFARELIAGGAPGIHLYTFNQAATSLEVLDRAGVRPLPVKGTTP